jgi:putative transposase
MPEHVHLLLSEPEDRGIPLSKALQSLKLSVSKHLTPTPFWQTRYYDFNVFTHNKRVEKLK